MCDNFRYFAMHKYTGFTFTPDHRLRRWFCCLNKKTPAITITAGVPSFIIVNYVAILQSLIAEFEIHFHQYSEPYNNRQAAIQYLIR